MKVLTSVLILGICCMASLIHIQAPNTEILKEDENVKVVINGARTGKGHLVIAVFDDQAGFKARKPIQRIVLKKSDLPENQAVFHLNPGTYGISVLDDENVNNKMDYNFIGIPKEGFGFSNYYHTGFSKPHSDNFKFSIKKGEEQTIKILLRYI